MPQPRLIRIARLVRAQAPRRQCEIDLCCTVDQDSVAPDSPAYLVNVREGQGQQDWQESSKTLFAVTLARAQQLFDQVLASKLEQGFVEQGAGAPAVAPTPVPAPATAPARAPVAGPAHQVLLARLAPRAWSGLRPHERSRTVWRIGELRLAQAVPRMVELIASGDAMLDYCLAHAIGRCGDAGAAQAMQLLHQHAKPEHVRRMAGLAWLTLASPQQRREHGLALLNAWPPALHSAWDEAVLATSPQPLLLAADRITHWNVLRHDDWIEQLYQLTLADIAPIARAALLRHVRDVPLTLDVFRAVRHLAKAAEFSADPDLFGVLQLRLETARPLFFNGGYGNRVYVDRKYVDYAKEAARADSRVGFSNLTRNYLRRRGWRMLRKLGAARDPAFIDMAVGALLACDDSAADQPRCRRLAHWDRNTRQTHVELRYYSPYARWLLFNELVHHQRRSVQTSRTGLNWWAPASNDSLAPRQRTVREEAFPTLWDGAPEALLALLKASRCLGVHAFAALALADNKAFCQQLSLGDLKQLLQSAYAPTVELAFELVRARLARGEGDDDCMILLLESVYLPAAQFALSVLNDQPARFAQQPRLLLAMLLSPHAIVRAYSRTFGQLATPETRAALASLLCQRLALADQADAALLGDLQWTLEHLLASAIAAFSDSDLAAWCALLASSVAWVVELASLALAQHPAGIAHVPPATLAYLLQHENRHLQAAGARLFGALPLSLVASQPDLVGALACSPLAPVRQGVNGLIIRMAADPACAAFCLALVSHLLDALFRSDQADEGAADQSSSLHDDVLALCRGPLAQVCGALDIAQQWRLLQARSQGAQALGAWLLLDAPALAPTLTVAQWAQLGKHTLVVVRQRACRYFDEHPDAVRQHLADALQLADSRWPDTLAFALDYFATRIPAEDWTLDYLVALCDHPQAAVQRLGRSLITSHTRVEEAASYLFKLAQHPSQNMQLFVSQWLESSIGNGTDQARELAALGQLRHYFLSVLSHVNRARTVKSRAIAFLRGQARRSIGHAQFVADIFVRQVVTITIVDKAQYIAALMEMQTAFPALAERPDWPLRCVPAPVRATREEVA